MISGTYKTRNEAETALKALQSQGVPAAVLETHDASLRQFVRLWQVIVPRGPVDSHLDTSPEATGT